VDARSAPKVNIVIPNWNGLRFLPSCLNSIERQTYSSFVITIVDNGSNDGSEGYLRKKYPQVRLIILPENLGFSSAVNAGIKSSDAPYIFLLNNDTELPKDCLYHLMTAAEAFPEYDFFSPKMLSFHHRTIIDGAGDSYLRGGGGYRLGAMEEDCAIYDRPGQVFGACAGAGLYRRALFDRIGLFDEDFFAYLEDVDLNLRINRFGSRGYYVPAARVYHIGSATSGSKINPFTVRLTARNSLFLLLKNYPVSLFVRFLPMIFIYQFFWFLFAVKKQQALAYSRGIWQGATAWKRMRKKYRGQLACQEKVISIEKFAVRLRDAEISAITSLMHRRQAAGKRNGIFKLYLTIFGR